MPKVLLVEDDNNLREIFEMRLQAEGYQTVSAGDGEEALVVAVKEKPDLVIADVMMPKLSGFEMVENMRAAPELANVKVIMMTALGQAEDRTRGEKLGVVKYLVKSQVTLEDFVRVVREVLPPNQDGTVRPADQPDNVIKPTSSNNVTKEESEKSMQDDSQAPSNAPADQSAPSGDQAASGNPISDAPASGGLGGSDPQTTAQEESAVQNQINNFANDPAAGAAPAADDDSAAPAPGAPEPPAPGGDVPVSPPPSDPAPAPDSPPAAPPAEPEGGSGDSGAPASGSPL